MYLKVDCKRPLVMWGKSGSSTHQYILVNSSNIRYLQYLDTTKIYILVHNAAKHIAAHRFASFKYWLVV